MDNDNSEILSALFRQCISLISRGRQKVHQSLGGVPEGQGRILRELLQTDGMSQKELAQKLQIRQPSLTELLLKLESGGYIERRQNKNDKRITNVFITDKSSEQRKQIGIARQKMSQDMFHALTDEEQVALINLLNKLVTAWTEELD